MTRHVFDLLKSELTGHKPEQGRPLPRAVFRTSREARLSALCPETAGVVTRRIVGLSLDAPRPSNNRKWIHSGSNTLPVSEVTEERSEEHTSELQSR